MNYEKISPTALSVAKSRTFSDIPYALEIFNATEEVEGKNGLVFAANHLRFEEVAPTFEARYKLVNKLILENKGEQILEVASGLSPRGIDFAQKGPFQYVEMDLPGIISSKIKILEKIEKKLPPNLHLVPGNALKLDDLKAATKHFNPRKKIIIVNEGLLRYLNFDEKSIVAKNIHFLLEKFGGVWITPDITLKKGLEKENKSISVIKNTKRVSGIDINKNSFENKDEAKKFFEKLGFKVEVHSFLEVEDELVSPSRLKISGEKVKEIIEPWVVFVMWP